MVRDDLETRRQGEPRMAVDPRFTYVQIVLSTVDQFQQILDNYRPVLTENERSQLEDCRIRVKNRICAEVSKRELRRRSRNRRIAKREHVRRKELQLMLKLMTELMLEM